MPHHQDNLQTRVQQVYERHAKDLGGQNAHCIPYLAQVPSTLSALVVVTAEGAVFQAGDSNYRFAIESISKVATLALALLPFSRKKLKQGVVALDKSNH
jgi:glutaminase